MLTGVILLSSGVNYFLTISACRGYYKKSLVEGVLAHMRSFRETLEWTSAKSLDLNGLSGVNKKCQEIVNEMSYGKYCQIVDNQGVLRYSSLSPRVRIRNNRIIIKKALAAKGRLIQDGQLYSGEKIYNFSLPLYNPARQRIGLLRVGVSLRAVTDKVAEIQKRDLIIVFFIVFLSMAGILIFNRFIIFKPVRNLLKAFDEFGRGNYGYRINFFARNELGILARSFNKMAEEHQLFYQNLLAVKSYTQLIIDNVLDILIVVDSNDRIKTLNRAGSGLLGYTSQELIGEPVDKILPAGLWANEQFRKLIDEGRIYNLNVTLVAKSGEKIPINFSASLIQPEAASGGESFIIGAGRDMRQINRLFRYLEQSNARLQEFSTNMESMVELRTQELQQAQKAALNMLEDLQAAKQNTEASRRNLLNIVEKSSDGMIVVDTTGKILFVNPAASRLFAVSLPELTGIVLGLPVGAFGITEVSIVRGNKELGVAQMRVARTQWQSDEAYLIFLHDITARKIAEEALLRAAQEWRSTFDAIGDGIALLDEQGRFLRCNQALCRYVNKPFSEITGHNCQEIIYGGEFTAGADYPVPLAKETKQRVVRSFSKAGRWFNISDRKSVV